MVILVLLVVMDEKVETEVEISDGIEVEIGEIVGEKVQEKVGEMEEIFLDGKVEKAVEKVEIMVGEDLLQLI